MRKISLQSINHATFTKNAITNAISFLKTGKRTDKTPHFAINWKDHLKVKEGKLYLDDKRVIAREDRDVFMRKQLLDKESTVPFGRTSGFHAISKNVVGISSRVWNQFIQKQKPVRAVDQRVPQTKNKGGRKAKQIGDIEIDLVEMQTRDLPKEWNLSKDFYLYTAVDRPTGLTFIRYSSHKTQAAIKPIIKESFDFYSKQFRMKVSDLKYTSDAGQEFFASSPNSPDNPFRIHKVEHKLVRKGASIESRNKYIQSVFHRLVRLKRGNIKSLVKQTQSIVNNTRNRIHKNKTPSELVSEQVGDVLQRFNKKRSSLDPSRRKPFEVGQTVRILLLRKDKDDKVGFKSYKGKTYTKQVLKIIGRTRKAPYRYRVMYKGQKKWYTQDNLIRTPQYDTKTEKQLAKLTSWGNVATPDSEKSDRLAELKNKKKARREEERKQHLANPRRSARSGRSVRKFKGFVKH